jgi:hypothetical protein
MRTRVWFSCVLLALALGLTAYWFTRKQSGDRDGLGSSPPRQGPGADAARDAGAPRTDRTAQDKPGALDPAAGNARSAVEGHATSTTKDGVAQVQPYPLPTPEEISSTTPPYVGLAFKADPTLGGADAFAAKHRGVSAHDRTLRLLAINAVIDQYVDGDPTDPTEAELYGALKDEAIWLKEHPEP